jgi:ribose 5-phosphate isomerase B
MRIAIGTDHAGYPIKEAVLKAVQQAGHQVIDLGTDSEISVDYPDYAEKVGNAIQSGDADRGILLCGSGIGACIAANKMVGVYAGICHDVYSAKQGVEHDGMNVLCLGGRIVDPDLAGLLVLEFLGAAFIGNDPGEERHKRRTEKTKRIEKGGIGS